MGERGALSLMRAVSIWGGGILKGCQGVTEEEKERKGRKGKGRGKGRGKGKKF